MRIVCSREGKQITQILHYASARFCPILSFLLVGWLLLRHEKLKISSRFLGEKKNKKKFLNVCGHGGETIAI